MRPQAQLRLEDIALAHKYYFLYKLLIICKCKYWIELQKSGPHQVRQHKVEKILAP